MADICCIIHIEEKRRMIGADGRTELAGIQSGLRYLRNSSTRNIYTLWWLLIKSIYMTCEAVYEDTGVLVHRITQSDSNVSLYGLQDLAN